MRIASNAFFWDQPATGSGQYTLELTRALAELEPSLRQTLVFPGRSRILTLNSETWDFDASGSERPILSSASPPVPVQGRTRAGIEAPLLRRMGQRLRRGLSVGAIPPWSPRRSAPESASGRDSPTSNLSKLLFEQLAFPRTAHRLRADVAHVPYFAPPLFPTRTTVVTIHDLIPLVLPAYRGSWLVRLYMQLAALAAPRAAAIIADSECSRRDVLTLLKVQPERVHVVYLAADDRYRPRASLATQEAAAVRRKYDLPERYVLYLGGFDQRKNLSGLIAAYTQVVREEAGAPPLVVGGRLPESDSAFSPDPRRLAREAGLGPAQVRTIGWVDERDKPALYSSALAFVFPSFYEGFGLPLLEAMSCGVPAIGSNTGSLPEVAGQAGLLVPPDDPAGLAAAILRVVRDPALAAEMRERGLAQAARFSWRRCAEETLAVYRAASGVPVSAA